MINNLNYLINILIFKNNLEQKINPIRNIKLKYFKILYS